MADQTLDVRGLTCPLPVLRANKAIRALEVGDRLTVLATDPAAPADFESFCETAGHVLVENREENATYVLVIRKSG